MKELWRPVVGYEGIYSVSATGKVWSHRSQKTLKPRLRAKYLAVKLTLNGKEVSRPVHQLVCEAFNGSRPSGLWCLHRDDNKENNSAANLYWGTPAQNAADRVRNGHSPANPKGWVSFDEWQRGFAA